MGYRSEVALLLYGTPEKVDIVDALLLQKLNPEYDRGMFEEAKQVRDEQVSYGGVTVPQRSILWTFQDIKWYGELDSYKGHLFDWVHEINDVVTDDKKDWSLNVEFVRIGENLEDNEEAYSDNSDYLLHINRNISTPDIFNQGD